MFAKNPAVELGKVMNFMQMENIYTPDRFFYNATTGFYCFKGITGEREICAKNSKDDLYKELAEGENINVTEFRAKLAKYFKPRNEEFYRIAGQNFNWN